MTKLKGLNHIRKSIAKQGRPSSGNPMIDNLRSGNVGYQNQFNDPTDSNLAIDDSMFLTGMENENTMVSDGGIAERKAKRQPWIAKATAGVARAGAKAVAEVAKMPGIIGGIGAGTVGQVIDGITGEDNTDFMQTAFNNGWIKSINEANDYINNEVIPVHVKKAIQDGNIWDNITSIDFWATDGADGLGYIAAMLVPGAAINRFSLAQKLLGLGKYAKMAGKTDDAITAMSKLGITPANADLHMGTLANTVFEAGAEAQGAMQGYEEGLKMQLDSGEITQEQFDVKIKNASKIGRDVFLSNVAILIGPNAVMSKMVWGKARNKVTKGLYNAKKGVVESMKDPKLLKKIEAIGGDFGKALGREGFFEEGLQSTVESYVTDSYENDTDYDPGEFVNAYAETLKSVEGQKAVLLGGVFGGGMQSVQGAKSRKGERNKTNDFVDKVNSAFANYDSVVSEDVYQRNEEGEIIMEEDEEGNPAPAYDNKKLAKKLESAERIEVLSAMYDVAIETDDKGLLEQVKDEATTNLVVPFILNDNIGIEVLREHLTNSAALAKTAEDTNKDPKDEIEKIISKATYLKEAYNNFNDFAPSTIKLNVEGATDTQKQDFMNQLLSVYVNNKGRRKFLEDKQGPTNKLFDEILEEKGVSSSEFEDNASRKRDWLQNDKRLAQTYKQLKALDSQLDAAKSIDNEFWNEESTNKAFEKFIAKEAKLEEDTKKAPEATKVLEEVEKADTPKKVDEATQGKATLEDKKKKEEEAAVDAIKKSIEADPTIKNLRYNLDKLDKLKISTFSVNDIYTAVEKRIADKLKVQEEFADYLVELHLSLTKGNNDIKKRVEGLEDTISLHTKRRNKIADALKSENKSPKGRNAKIIKDLIKETQTEIDAIDKVIAGIVKEKEGLEKDLIAIEKELKNLVRAAEFVEQRFDQIEQLEFESVEDIVNYIKENLVHFKDHKFDMSRLLTHKFYTEQNIDGLNNMIEKLSDYQDILRESLLSKLQSEGNTEDVQFLRNELKATSKELFNAKKDVVAAKEKLGRINNSVAFKELTEELDFWNAIKGSKRKFKPSVVYNNSVINKAAAKKKKVLAEEKIAKEELKKEQAEQAKAASEKFNDAVDAETLSKLDYIDYIKANFNEQEGIPSPPKSIKLPDAFNSTDPFIVTKITEQGISISQNGKGFSLKDSGQVSTGVIKKSTGVFNTEGAVVERIIEDAENLPKDKEGNVLKENISTVENDARVITGTDNPEGLSFIPQAAVDFERAPRNKKTEEVSFEINTEYTVGKQGEALKKLKTATATDIEFLVDHLPINVIFGDKESAAKAPLETLTNDPKYNGTFNKTSRPLREAIIKEMILNNSSIEDITTTIAGQKNGQITVAKKVDNKVVENSVADLYEFSGDKSKIKTKDIYVVNDQGTLENFEAKYYTLGRRLAPGEVYVMTKMANGLPFPLKLNIKKVEQSEAELLYEIYKFRFEKGVEKGGKAHKIIDTNEEVIEKVKQLFKEELGEEGLFTKNSKNINDLTIKDIVDFLIWDGTKSIKSQVRFHGQFLKVMDATYNKVEFLESKDDIIKSIVKNKRRNIAFKRRPKEDRNSLNFDNRQYVDYILDKKVLNTNAVTKDSEGNFLPTFQGDTTLYLHTNSVKVNGETSLYNVAKKKSFKNNISGSTIQLHKVEPKLGKKRLILHGQDFYIDENDAKKLKPGATLSEAIEAKVLAYQRVSNVTNPSKDKQSLRGANSYNAAKRGDVTDNLIRDFFSVGFKNIDDFMERGKKYLAHTNKENNKYGDIYLSDNTFTELYTIVSEYEIEFHKRGYTIYSTTNPLFGTLIKNKKKIPTAGSMDLLAIDKAGNRIIIDIKTSNMDRYENYQAKDGGFYKDKDLRQQSAYAELYRQMTGKTVTKMLILPITFEASENNTVFGKVQRTKAPGSFIEIPTEQSIYDIMGEVKPSSIDNSDPYKTKKPASTSKGGKFELTDNIENAATAIDTHGYTAEQAETVPFSKEGSSYLDNYTLESFGEFAEDISFGKEKTPTKKSSKPKEKGEITRKSEEKSVPLQKTEEMKDKIDTSKLSDKDATAKVREILMMKNLGTISKDLRGMLKTEKTPQAQLDKMVKLLLDKVGNNEDVKKLCNKLK